MARARATCLRLHACMHANDTHALTCQRILCVRVCACWCTYMRCAWLLYCVLESAVIFVDLNGFGLSSGRDLQTGTWQRDAALIVKGLLNAFGAKRHVATIGFCGGAATFYRALVAYPRLFAGERHVAHNCVTSEWPESIVQTLAAHGCRLLVTWCEDEDHSRYCVAYKALTKLRKAACPVVDFINIPYDVLPAVGAWVRDMGRGSSSLYCFTPSETYRETVRRFWSDGRE